MYKTAKHVNPQSFVHVINNVNLVKLIGAIFVVLLTISIIGIFTARNAFAANPNQALTPDKDKITATIQDDGLISFSSCNLINTSDRAFTLESASVSVTEEAKSVSAVNNCEITMNSFGACIYNGLPNGQEQLVTGLAGLATGCSTPLNLDLTNLDKQSALSLCGKQVFILKLTPIPITTYSLLTEGNGEWKEENATINSIDVLGYEEPKIDNENITYLGTDQQEHTVTATPSEGYAFSEITSETNKFTAYFGTKYTLDVNSVDYGE